MKTTALILFLNSFFFIKIIHAQLSQGALLPSSPMPGPTPMLPTQELTAPPPFDWASPRCYPETAKAYFLPAPPSSPIITILDPKDMPPSFNEARIQLASNIVSNRPTFPPPPASSPIPMLPDLKDEVPSLIQDRFCRLADSDVKVCDACASLIEKLPIFKFDQELLDGFLAGVGL